MNHIFSKMIKKRVLGAALILLLVCANTAFAATVNESESNNSYATADAIAFGDTIVGNLNGPGGGADNDDFSFTLASAGTKSVKLSLDGQASETAIHYISIIDNTTSAVVASGNASASNWQPTFTFTGVSGHSYYIVLIKPTGSATYGGYHVTTW